MANLKIKDLSLSYGCTEVLHDINLSIAHGEFIVLVGPSGSGKSTILRSIAGLESPTKGEIEIDEKVINDLPPKKRDIAMVFQNYALYPHMTVAENIGFPLKMKGVKQEELKFAVNKVSELLGLSQYLNKRPKELSGGERQRVALGRAIVRKPKLFLMDEPLSNLDAKLRTHMRGEILKIKNNLNATVIYVTHDQIEALTMGDKIAVLNNGRIQQYDTPENIYNFPENTFVASFIGSPPVNLFDITFLKNGVFKMLGTQLSNLFISFEMKSFIQEGEKYIIGFRPEDLSLGKDSSLKGEVKLIEMLGDHYLIYLMCGNREIVVKDQSLGELKMGDSIGVSPDLSKALLFDYQSGNRIYPQK